jgi:hypothetical protein
MKPSTSLGRETSPSPEAPTPSSADGAFGDATAQLEGAPGATVVRSAPAPKRVGLIRKTVAILLALLAYHNFLQIQQPIHVHEFYVIAALLGVPLACIRSFAGRCPRLETAGWVVLIFQTLVAVRSL